MTRSTVVLSLGYWFSAFSLGLLLHPYKTVRQLVRERIMMKLRFLPMVLWVVSWVAGLAMLRVGGKLGLEGEWVVGLKAVLGFLFLWWSVFVLLWQAVLFYLWRRFQILVG